ncbi:restriction endonuclease [Aestuariimicrobium soli]|uniref:restriction endonuclease n=1 Tax=Aestuariimicrobium soli TaxID=2035834 RepID=UPI003EB9C0E1
MSAPTWEQYMAPTLSVLSDGEVRRSREIVEAAADLLALTDEQRHILIPSGQEQYRNRGNWALSYLSRSGATERPARGHHRITDVGRRLLAEHPEGITEKHLRALSGDPNAPHTWKVFPISREATVSDEAPLADVTLDPEEQIAAGIARIHADVADELLARILDQEPAFFEQAVLDLLMGMGYGGAEGTATRTQLSNDGGIDGVIDQDALGLSRIHVQAKRHSPTNPIGRPEIQAFVGAMAGSQANQGVFITTGRFSQGARQYAATIPTRIVLIDGERMTSLMIRYGVGVQVKRTVQIVEIDEDFFE